MSFHVPNGARIRTGRLATDNSFGNNGAFEFEHYKPASSLKFFCIASDGEGWEHVSVSFPKRCPTWEEMCVIKALFWDPEDCVMQYHPPSSEHVSYHDFCLHLWRPVGVSFPSPPSWMVGPKGVKP